MDTPVDTLQTAKTCLCAGVSLVSLNKMLIVVQPLKNPTINTKMNMIQMMGTVIKIASYAKNIVNVTMSRFNGQTSSIMINDRDERPRNEPI